jgi:hypothetical protein
MALVRYPEDLDDKLFIAIIETIKRESKSLTPWEVLTSLTKAMSEVLVSYGFKHDAELGPGRQAAHPADDDVERDRFDRTFVCLMALRTAIGETRK